MYVAKPFRIFFAAGVSGLGVVAAFAATRPTLGSWAFLAAFVGMFVAWTLGEVVINKIDFWLRRTTKDARWLASHEGQTWLKTPEGRAWEKK